MKKATLVLALVLVSSTLAYAQPAQNQDDRRGENGFGFNPITAFEGFVEKAEVSLAGAIGGKELKAKALANNAEESLNKAEKLAEKNKTNRAQKMLQKYEKNINKSARLAEEDENLSKEINEYSNRSKERIKSIKDRTPEKAEKGLEKALDNQERERRDKALNESNRSERPNKSMPKMPDRIRDKFNSSKTELNDSSNQLNDTQRNISPEPQIKQNNSGLEDLEKETGRNSLEERSSQKTSVEEAAPPTPRK